MPGLDGVLVNKINYKRAINRIAIDIQNDFIFAPHYSAIFKYAPEELWSSLKKHLNSGNYNPQLPITIEVPKKSGLTRPGSILNPVDRLLYQCIADEIATEVEAGIDRDCVYSHVLATNSEADSGKMFNSSSESYGNLRRKIIEYCTDGRFNYAIVADIACYFERIYQHVLINMLRSTKCEGGYINLLEKLLSGLTSKDSHGIVQGIYPSDLFGNYYLCSFDSYLKIKNASFVRYVDDYWIFFETLEEAQKALVDICTYVRKEGLYLNEYKTGIADINKLHFEETELDTLFNEAKEEFSNWGLVYSEYSFEPFEIEEHDSDVEVEATLNLYSKKEENFRLAERIDKFCLPRFAISKSDIAVNDAIESIINRPHLSDVYAQYLKAMFEVDDSIGMQVEILFIDNKLNYEWQMMWVLGMLYHIDNVSLMVVDKAYSLLENYNVSPAVRAICALIVSKHGDGARRRLIRNHYSSEPSSYVKEAILYSTKFFPSQDDKNTCINIWETHSEINKLISTAIRNEGKQQA